MRISEVGTHPLFLDGDFRGGNTSPIPKWGFKKWEHTPYSWMGISEVGAHHRLLNGDFRSGNTPPILGWGFQRWEHPPPRFPDGDFRYSGNKKGLKEGVKGAGGVQILKSSIYG